MTPLPHWETHLKVKVAVTIAIVSTLVLHWLDLDHWSPYIAIPGNLVWLWEK